MTRTRAAAFVAAATLLCTACAGGARVSAPPDGPEVVATVGSTAITAGTVSTLLPDVVGGAPVETVDTPASDLVRTAVARAVRDELFALEAQDRGLRVKPLPGTSMRTARIRTLIEQERDAHGLRPADVEDAQARAWYASHRHLFADIQSMRVSWARLADERAARDLLTRSSSADRATFGTLARAKGSGVLASGLAVLDHDGKGADVSVARVAFALRRDGEVGLVVDPKGTWWVARVDAVMLRDPAWDNSLASRVRMAISDEAEQKRFDSLAERLKRKWPVTEFPERFSAIKEA